MNYNAIGKKIRNKREEIKLTQKDLAEKVGVSWEMISRYERGVSSPLHRISSIAEALNSSVAELLQEGNIPNLKETTEGNRVPLFTNLPQNMNFNRTATYYYAAPDWILQKFEKVFALDPKVPEIKTAMLSGKGPLFIYQTQDAQVGDIVLIRVNNKLLIDKYDDDFSTDSIIGVVLAEEKRFI
jgi:transcriptional regulator with XRE-family HTH domain